MAIKNLAQITCSLNLGLIYSLDYDYSPGGGATIRLFFVNERGVYQRPQYMQKAQIRVGAASFSMYVVASDIQLSSGRRVMEVIFVDDTFRLDNYMVVLTGKGCGYNVYQLGTDVDNRSPAQKADSALDSDAQQIAELTQFPDVEYSFDEFLNVLRRHFSVAVSAFYDTDVTNTYSGSFRDVLDSWCSLFNLSWYIENSVIKIFDPTKLTITLPTEDSLTDPISYNSLEDVRGTYGKTCANWFQQEGGQYSLNQTSDNDGPTLIRYHLLLPVGSERNLPQAMTTREDLNQCAAAQFGEPFWFLYNYWLGSTSTNCGWTPITPSTSLSVVNSTYQAGGRIAQVNEPVFNQRFEAFNTYGESIAGRYYLSERVTTIPIDRNYTWFSEGLIGNGQSFLTSEKTLDLQFLTPPTLNTSVLPGTSINQFYSGVNYVGDRIAYRDDSINATSFSLTPAQQALVNSTYESITFNGSQSMDFNSQLAPIYGTNNTYVGYNPISVPQDLVALFNNIPNLTTGFLPRYTYGLPIQGITTLDYSTLKASQTEQDGIEIVNDSGPTVVSNTAVIKTLKQGAYTAYYDKYAKCASAHTAGNYFGHRFEMRQISSDNEIGVTFSKPAPNVYKITRDYGLVDSLVNNPLLPQMAQARTFPTRKVSFTVNYFYDVPTDFLTNGLVGLSLSVGDGGVTATYSYSNEILQVPEPANQFALFEQMMRNSWIRRYQPNQVIS